MKNIENLTIKEAQQKLEEYKSLQKLFNVNVESEQVDKPYEVGINYLIRTVTMIVVGTLKGIYKQELILENASWIADTGRFHNALKDGIETISSSEIEPFVSDVIIGRGAIVDCTAYVCKLPTEQK